MRDTPDLHHYRVSEQEKSAYSSSFADSERGQHAIYKEDYSVVHAALQTGVSSLDLALLMCNNNQQTGSSLVDSTRAEVQDTTICNKCTVRRGGNSCYAPAFMAQSRIAELIWLGVAVCQNHTTNSEVARVSALTCVISQPI